jgi:hexosaminidase
MEVDVLFHSQMIHIGGDEVSYGNNNWTLDPDVKALMKQYDLTDLKKVEKYFLQRMADSVKVLDNKILAWDEAVDADLPVNETIIFWWRHNHPEQLKRRLTKGMQLYFARVCRFTWILFRIVLFYPRA